MWSERCAVGWSRAVATVDDEQLVGRRLVVGAEHNDAVVSPDVVWCATADSVDSLLLKVFGLGGAGFDFDGLDSYRKKFMLFLAADYDPDSEFPTLPAFPLRLATLIRFGWFLPSHNVTAGWGSVSNYLGAVREWNRALGHPDPVEAEVWVWDKFRDNFPKHIQIIRKYAVKIALRVGHLESMSLDIDLAVLSDRRDMCCYALLFFASCRIGHFSPKSGQPKHTVHTLRWRHVLFFPSVVAATMVYLFFPSTKARDSHTDNPWWTCVGLNDQNPSCCAVRLLRLRFLLEYSGDPDGWIFAQASGAPLLRTTFNDTLRARLQRAAPRLGLLPGVFTAAAFSGKSFRSGGLSALGSTNIADHRLADAADHRSVDTSRGYTSDDTVDRAGNSSRVAQLFSPQR
jgi:hypothetical protein